ncbi:MAG: glycosyl hydrolase family 8 [Thermoleophilaceae bacterium]
MTRAFFAAALAALALAVAACGSGGKGAASSSTELSPDPTVASAQRFLRRYVMPDGRVSRIDQGGDTVGEGQAYAMLMAAAIGDEKRFDLVWDWTKANIRRKDGLLAFLWKDGKVVNADAASDADLDTVRALLAASCRFNRPELRKEALSLARSIMRNETVVTRPGTVVLVAGQWARKPPITINPSYFSPATFSQLFTLTHDVRWGTLAATGRTLTSILMEGRYKLPPDWAQLRGGNPVPTGPPANPSSPSQFTFDAPRTLMRMAEDPNPSGQHIAGRAWRVFEGKAPASIPVEHNLAGKPVGGDKHPIGLVAAAAAAGAAGQPAARARLLNAAEALDRQSPTYYGAAWVALGRIMLTTRYLSPACSK